MPVVLLGSHLHVHLQERSDPGSSAELVFTSQTRQVRISGPYGDKLYEFVLPLLNGRWSPVEIADRVLAMVPREVTEEFIGELMRRHLASEVILPTNTLEADRLKTTVSWLQEAQFDAGHAISALRSSCVAVVGVRQAGAFAVRSLASAGVGRLILIDPRHVRPSETRPVDSSLPSASSDCIEALAQEITRTSSVSVELSKPERSVAGFLDDQPLGIDRVLLCIEDYSNNLIDEVAEVCRARSIEWTICVVRAWEGVVGPTFKPGCIPCFECYTARQIGPVSPRVNDTRSARESHAMWHGDEAMTFGHSVIGGLAALEIIRGVMDPDTPRGGCLHIVDFANTTITPHRFLPQPWCDLCKNH